MKVKIEGREKEYLLELAASRDLFADAAMRQVLREYQLYDLLVGREQLIKLVDEWMRKDKPHKDLE